MTVGETKEACYDWVLQTDRLTEALLRSSATTVIMIDGEQRTVSDRALTQCSNRSEGDASTRDGRLGRGAERGRAVEGGSNTHSLDRRTGD